MVNIKRLSAVLPVLALILIFAFTVNAGTSVVTHTNTFQTQYTNPYYSPAITPSVISTNQISQVTQARIYNNDTAAWLLTCPSTPKKVGSNTPEYIDSGDVPYIAGDVCGAPATPLTSTVGGSMVLSWSTTSLATASTTISPSDVASVTLKNLGYSPMVDGQISNGYSTKSNIFDSVPSTNQQGIWTWFAKYANMQNAGDLHFSDSQSGLTYQVDHTVTNTITDTVYKYTCTYGYSVSASYTASNFNNLNMPFVYTTGQTNTLIMPFFLYDYNLSVPSLPSSTYINQTYDIYDPSNYATPMNSIDPFPINTSSYVFANLKGAFTPYEIYTESLWTNGVPSVDFSSASQIIDAQSGFAIGGGSTSSSTSSSSSSGGSSCAVTDLNCIAAVIHRQDGGSFMSEPQYAQYEIQGVQQLAVQYGFPWEYMYALLMSQECENCNYMVWPMGSQSSPTSSQNCYNYWSYTTGGTAGPMINDKEVNPNNPAKCYNFGDFNGAGGYDMQNFNINNDPVASMTAANREFLTYWAGRENVYQHLSSGGCDIGTANLDTWVTNMVTGPGGLNPYSSPTPYIDSTTRELEDLFGPNWAQKIAASSTPSGSGCISSGPTATVTPVTSTFTFNAISVTSSPNDYTFVLTNSITGTSSSISSETGGPVAVPFDPSIYSSYANCFALEGNACTSIGGVETDIGNTYNSNKGDKPVYAMFTGTLTWENYGTCNYGLRAFLTLPNGWVLGYGDLSSIAPLIQQQGGNAYTLSIQCATTGTGPGGRPLTQRVSAKIDTHSVQVQAGDIIGYTSGTVDFQLLAPYGSVSTSNTIATTMYLGSPWARTVSAVDPRAMLIEAFKLYGSSSIGSAEGDAIIGSSDACYVWNYEFSSADAAEHGLQMTTPKCPTAYTPGSGGSSSGYYLEMLRLIPKGYFNATNIPPSTVPASQSSSTWQSSWDTYWNEMQNLQSGSVYVTKQIPINTGGIPGLKSTITVSGTKYYDVQNEGFIPSNITVDNFDNVYITGNFKISACSSNCNSVYPGPSIGYYYIPGIVVVSNTIGTPSLFGSYLTQTPFKLSDWKSNLKIGNKIVGSISPDPQNFDEIAVSPTGASIYLASPQIGYISVFNGQSLSFIGNINLDYVSSSLSTSTSGSVSSSTSTVGQSTVALNIGNYIANGGIYGIGVTQSSIQSTKLKNLFSSQYSSLSNYQYDAPNFHHPLAISDQNGYLYVLDDWSNSNQQALGQGACVPSGMQYHTGGCTASQEQGIYFQILSMRIFNDTGGEVPVNPTKFNALYSVQQDSGNGGYSTGTPYTTTSTVFPPYGWILSANVSGTSAPPVDSVSFCGSDQCTYSPSNAQLDNSPFKPIGPLLMNSGSTGGKSVFPSGSQSPTIKNIGFSADVNNYVSILFPNPTLSPGTANLQDELLLAKFQVENYTSYSAISPSYNCYSSDSGIAGDACTSTTNAKDNKISEMSEPISAVVNPFQTLESTGSFQSVPLQGILSTTLGLNGQASSETIQQVNQQTKCSNQNQNGQYSGPCINGFTSTNLNTAANSKFGTTTPTTVSGSTLATFIEGEVIVPYSYDYQSSITHTFGGSSMSGNPPPDTTCPTISTSTSTSKGTIYTYSIVPASNSNQFTANVQSGASYIQYVNNGNFYIPQLTNFNTTLPEAVIASLLTNREFGTILLNVTLSTLEGKGNEQAILAVSHLLNYNLLSYTQGNCGNNACPAYQAIISSQTSGTEIPSILANPAKIVFSSPVTQTYSTSILSSLVALFDWYKSQTYVNNLNSIITTGTYSYLGNAHSIQGYQRLIYVLNDKFNNTLYVPIDADIARITKITLSVTPQVSNKNANQTKLQISGTAGFTDVSGKFIPLSNNVIYLYYDGNINYVDSNGNPFYTGQGYVANPGSIHTSASDIVTKILCAFSDKFNTNCLLANPGSSNVGQSSVANTVNFATSYNSMSTDTCSLPPQSLLASPTMNCNIYGNDGNAKHTQLSQSCPISASGNDQYCYPIYTNGTGICTSQLGLMAMVNTKSDGSFSYNTVVCGYGTGTIIASFYGYPAKEPITVYQNALPYASKTYNYPTTSTSFKSNNYTATPNDTIVSTQIGELLLSVGGVNLSYATIALLIAAVIVAFKVRNTNRKIIKHGRKRIR